MSTLWPALISAGAGLLGAVIGVIGSLKASQRAAETAFRQVRYAQVEQLRYEAHAIIYALITEFDIAFRQWLARAGHSRAQLTASGPLSGSEAIREADKAISTALSKNSLWISEDMTQRTTHVLLAFAEKREKLTRSAFDSAFSDEEYQRMWSQIQVWHSTRGTRLIYEVHEYITKRLVLPAGDSPQ